MPIFSQLKYNNYVPQYVGAPLDEYLMASNAIQNRYDKVREGYSLVGELADTLETSPLDNDKALKASLMNQVNSSIEEAARRGDFDNMQNEMRALAKLYAKQSAPLKENLSRFQSAEKAILESKLPQSHINYLRNNLYNKPGLTYDENGVPQYLTPDSFAENVDLREVYEKFINDYKSDKAPDGIYAVRDPETGLVEYFANRTHERVDPNEVLGGLQRTALFDPKVQAFILQDAAASGQDTSNWSGQDLVNYAQPLMEAYANKAAFDKVDLEWKLGEAGNYRAKKKEDEILSGFTFNMNWGVPAREGRATPSDLRKTRESLDSQRQSVADEFGKFLKQNNVDPLTGKSKDGTDYSEEVQRYNDMLDAVDAQKYELLKVEADARKDAGLPADYTPNQQVLDRAQAAAESQARQMRGVLDRAGNRVYNEEQIAVESQKAYNRSIDNSNDANLKAYRAALAKNAKDRTDVKGVTSFSKKLTEEFDNLGNAFLSGDWGHIAAEDVATGRPLTDLNEYGTAVKNARWTVENGKMVLVYQTGDMDGNQFIPSGKSIKITAPDELEQHMIKKGLVDAIDLDIMKQVPKGKIQVGKLKADIEIKRNAQTGPAPVVVVLNDGKKRVAFDGQGDAIKFLSNLAKIVNGN